MSECVAANIKATAAGERMNTECLNRVNLLLFYSAHKLLDYLCIIHQPFMENLFILVLCCPYWSNLGLLWCPFNIVILKLEGWNKYNLCKKN